jgi:small-conductance mechanosensitive channel/CRP-like cAMP-binding protein
MLIFVYAAAIFVGLSTAYWLLYKLLDWRQSFISPIARRVRPWVYLLIPLCTLNWVVAKLYHGLFAANVLKPWMVWAPRYGITALLMIIVVEALLVLVFDYYYAARHGIRVPPIIQTVVRSMVYVVVALLILLNFFDIKIVAGVLIGSLLFLFGIGLLMQDTLSNLFAGFSLQVSQLYTPGDWLRVGEHEGRVEGSDWRSLSIRTAAGDLVTLPLSLLAKVEVVNLSAGTPLHAGQVEVAVGYDISPERVERVLLEALRDVTGLCTEPAPDVRLLAFEAQGIRYVVRFWMADVAARDALQTTVHRAVWYHFQREAIPFAAPTSQVVLRRPASHTELPGQRVALLREIHFLRILPPEQLAHLADRLRLELYARGETICSQGEAGQTFYVIARGCVRVTATNDTGQTIFTQELHEGNFFGEISLLTGEPRTATVTAEEESELLVMDKAAMRAALDANTELADYMSGVLAQRQHELQESRARVAVTAGHGDDTPSVDSLRRELLRKIVNFFSY